MALISRVKWSLWLCTIKLSGQHTICPACHQVSLNFAPRFNMLVTTLLPSFKGPFILMLVELLCSVNVWIIFCHNSSSIQLYAICQICGPSSNIKGTISDRQFKTSIFTPDFFSFYFIYLLCWGPYSRGGGGPLVFQGGCHPRKKINIIRVVFQDQTMYARTSFRVSKTC